MKKIFALMAAAMMIVFTAGTAQAYANTATYRGQGTTNGALSTEICGTENGAEVDGAYILWVMTATKASLANISINGEAPAAMTKTGNGTFKYVSDWYDLDGLTATGTYNNDPKNVQLVISHGCPGETYPS